MRKPARTPSSPLCCRRIISKRSSFHHICRSWIINSAIRPTSCTGTSGIFTRVLLGQTPLHSNHSAIWGVSTLNDVRRCHCALQSRDSRLGQEGWLDDSRVRGRRLFTKLVDGEAPRATTTSAVLTVGLSSRPSKLVTTRWHNGWMFRSRTAGNHGEISGKNDRNM